MANILDRALSELRRLPQSGQDAVGLALGVIGFHALVTRNDFGRHLFDSLPPELHLQLEGQFFSFVLATLALVVFSVRRWKEVAARERQSRFQATHDFMTGLLNRRGFFDALARAGKERADQSVSCILFDLDGFKAINDSFGHAAGDAILKAIPDRLSPLLPRGAIFARLSGDEFAIVVAVSTPAEAELAEAILKAVSETYFINDRNLRISTSIGIARATFPISDPEGLLRDADFALYRSKHAGRGRITLYSTSIKDECCRRTYIETALKSAIVDQRIVPHYQPLVRVSTGALSGFEVLARWNDENLGNIPPSEFIPLAADMGLISDLTHSLMRRALKEASDWPHPLRLSFNIAPQDLARPDFAKDLLALVREIDFDASRIDIEVTEESCIAHPEMVSDAIFILKQHGITFSLDDFGVGYSSILNLRNILFDTIKIDRSLVLSGSIDPRSRALLEAVVRLGHSVSTRVLAEGVETVAERDLILSIGCDEGQGWLYGRPERTPDFSLANVRSVLHFRTRASL